MVINGDLPSDKLTVCYFSHGPLEIVDLPMKHGGSFHSFLYVYQRVNMVIFFLLVVLCCVKPTANTILTNSNIFEHVRNSDTDLVLWLVHVHISHGSFS